MRRLAHLLHHLQGQAQGTVAGRECQFDGSGQGLGTKRIIWLSWEDSVKEGLRVEAAGASVKEQIEQVLRAPVGMCRQYAITAVRA